VRQQQMLAIRAVTHYPRSFESERPENGERWAKALRAGREARGALPIHDGATEPLPQRFATPAVSASNRLCRERTAAALGFQLAVSGGIIMRACVFNMAVGTWR
jgi:hypothetical protein